MGDLTDPEIRLEEKRVVFKGNSRGQEYDVKLKLLRGINVTESKHVMNQWSVTFDLQKLTKEPFAWLKKDHDRVYSDDCQHAKELWREAYFTAKLNGEDPSKGKRSEEDSDVPQPQKDKDREKEKFQKLLKEF